ncbi:DUF3090 domain-containing protein [Rathayibacter soli]|uniref:DUF3090 domain-containing protein n=1 Tax=Rathayibacter soli TaxID=3144168 RepID=UPI0027E5B236|nr:DUF3090 domain-containing protein [Glaciibacter superstes]
MPTIAHVFDWPDRIVVGTIGEPGSRTFYLQACTGARIVNIMLEKEQSAVLGEKIDEILDQLMAGEGNPFSVPAVTPIELVDNDPLRQPVDVQFRAGTMTLGWDPATAQVVIEVFPYVDAEDPDSDLATAAPAEMMLVRIPVGTARAFAKRTREVVGAGRPVCPFCGNPMDASGHVCPLPDDF